VGGVSGERVVGKKKERLKNKKRHSFMEEFFNPKPIN
jgi:hypothetical protein